LVARSLLVIRTMQSCVTLTPHDGAVETRPLKTLGEFGPERIPVAAVD
jgi:hypothetical protein